MMKKIGLFLGIGLLTGNVSVWSQGNEVDAYTLTNTELGGTARSMAMGGAFGALGGDISVISTNPAGLGIYRSSEISGTLDLSMVKTSSDWAGMTIDRSKTRFSPTNVGFSLYFPTSGSVRSWNLGFSYNRLKNYKRSYKMLNNVSGSAMAEYVAWRASHAYGYGKGISEDELIYEENKYDPYNNGKLSGQWLSILGYGSEMFGNMDGASNNSYQSSFGWRNSETGNWDLVHPFENTLIVNEKGYMDEYNIGFGVNVSNFLFLGASISVTDMDYRYSSYYEEFYKYEKDPSKNDWLYLENWLNTEGTAMSFNAGAIMNLQTLRLGVAYNSPRWYRMTDYFKAWAGTEINGYEKPFKGAETPGDIYSEYRFHTPGKWIFSGAIILGKTALVSADYELMNYKNMRYADRDGFEDGYAMNNFIKEDYTWSQTFKLGAEIKVTPQFAVRAGYMIQTSPMRYQLGNNEVEVEPSGTIPHFTVGTKPTNYYTVGLGYRFTPNFFMDLACVYRYNSAYAYAHSQTYHSNRSVDVYSEPARLKTETTHVALTLGYKF
jgi:hypothetical protein